MQKTSLLLSLLLILPLAGQDEQLNIPEKKEGQASELTETSSTKATTETPVETKKITPEPAGPLIASGAAGQTYYTIARSIKDVAWPELTVQASAGSIENLNLLKEAKAKLGLCQVDILVNKYLLDREVKKHVRIILPLFSEELHIVARKDITNIEGLVGKKISAGVPNSGTNITSRIILGTNKISQKNSTIFDYGTAASLNRMQSGEIDAFFAVAGAPVQSLLSADNANWHFLPMGGSNYELLTGKYFPYEKTNLGKEHYPFITGKIPTLSIRSLLVARADLEPEKVRQLIQKIFQNKARLEQTHTKWRQTTPEVAKAFVKAQAQYFHPAAVTVINSL